MAVKRKGAGRSGSRPGSRGRSKAAPRTGASGRRGPRAAAPTPPPPARTDISRLSAADLSGLAQALEAAAQPARPRALHHWFVVHFLADVLFAVPLFVAPQQFLALFGWTVVDPIAARLVAAALFGIGIESLLGRNASLATFRAMLNLKIIWSAAAVIGIAWSLWEGAVRPWGGWVVLVIFAYFHGLWVWWRMRLAAMADD